MIFEQEKNNRSNNYIKSLKQADQEWEEQSKTKEWLLEVLRNPEKAIKPSERFKQFFVFADYLPAHERHNLKIKRNITIRERIK